MGRGALIHDWNDDREAGHDRPRPGLVDETLRDGLQAPSATDPDVEEKLRILHLMHRLGIDSADIGMPGSSVRAYRHVVRLAQEVADARLRVVPHCACRATTSDLKLIADIGQKTSVPVAAYVFIGSSPIRQYAEGWTLDGILRKADTVLEFARRHQVETAFVTEDTTRSAPDDLEQLFRHALELGVERLVLCDTAGYADPGGTRNLVRWTRDLVDSIRPEVQLDWHGHNDRGLAVINAIIAWQAGADRVHGTGLGVGERVGNAAMDQLLVNFRLMGAIDNDLAALPEYTDAISRACKVPIPASYPVVGADAFRTATGIHAAAIGKAIDKRDEALADAVYSAVPASWVGKQQQIEVGFMSGKWNVRLWMKRHGIEYSDLRCEAVLKAAKRSNRILSAADIRAVIEGMEL